MALLRSVNNVPGVHKYEYRDKIYYNKYRYKLHFSLFGSNWLWRVYDERSFDNMVKNRAQNNRWTNTSAQQVKNDLMALKVPLLTFKDLSSQYTGKKKPMTIRSESGSVSVFSDDLQLLQKFDSEMKRVLPTLVTEVHEVQITGIQGTKFFVNQPKHNYRVYLKSKRIEKAAAEDLKAFIYRNSKFLYPSASLKRWESSVHSWNSQWLSGSYFIDYDDENLITLMMLTHGEYLGHRYKLEKHPDLKK